MKLPVEIVALILEHVAETQSNEEFLSLRLINREYAEHHRHM